ncbi:MAG: hypothetical protein JEZ07_20080 [Phycisphaerae bacterium]|nr:hypothetical protein [Phycisphaerae bacterium]
MTADHRGYSYKYDFENRLVSIKKGVIPVADYSYDALGHRVEAKIYDTSDSSGQTFATTLYYYDDWTVLSETDDTDTRTFVYGNYLDEVLMMNDGTDDFYYEHDQRYCPTTVIGPDGAGGYAVHRRYEYDAYGKRQVFKGDFASTPESSFYNPIGYTGQRMDYLDGGSLSLMYFKNRYYDTETGRFVTHDPAGYPDGMNMYGGYFAMYGGMDPYGESFNPAVVNQNFGAGAGGGYIDYSDGSGGGSGSVGLGWGSERHVINLGGSVNYSLPDIPTPIPGLFVTVNVSGGAVQYACCNDGEEEIWVDGYVAFWGGPKYGLTYGGKKLSPSKNTIPVKFPRWWLRRIEMEKIKKFRNSLRKDWLSDYVKQIKENGVKLKFNAKAFVNFFDKSCPKEAGIKDGHFDLKISGAAGVIVGGAVDVKFQLYPEFEYSGLKAGVQFVSGASISVQVGGAVTYAFPVKDTYVVVIFLPSMDEVGDYLGEWLTATDNFLESAAGALNRALNPYEPSQIWGGEAPVDGPCPWY